MNKVITILGELDQLKSKILDETSNHDYENSRTVVELEYLHRLTHKISTSNYSTIECLILNNEVVYKELSQSLHKQMLTNHEELYVNHSELSKVIAVIDGMDKIHNEVELIVENLSLNNGRFSRFNN